MLRDLGRDGHYQRYMGRTMCHSSIEALVLGASLSIVFCVKDTNWWYTEHNSLIALWITKIRLNELIGGNRILEFGKPKKDDLGFLIFSKWKLSKRVHRPTTACCYSNSLSTKRRKCLSQPRTATPITHHIIYGPPSSIIHHLPSICHPSGLCKPMIDY